MYAWVLMSNDYHLAIETPEANLVTGMQWLQDTFTRWSNIRHRAWGRVFGDRYKAVLVEPDAGYYQQTLCYFSTGASGARYMPCALWMQAKRKFTSAFTHPLPARSGASA